MARYLANADILNREDRSSVEDLSSLIARILKREIDLRTGEMKKFRLNFQFSTKESQPYLVSENEDSNSEIHFAISHMGQVPYVNVSNAISKMNMVHPDLAQTMYAVLETASVRSMGILTFSNCVSRFSRELNIPYDADEQAELDAEEIPYRTKEDIETLAQAFDISWIAKAEAVLSPYEVWMLAQKKQCPKWIKNCINAALEVAQAFEQEKSDYGLGVGIDADTIFSLGIVELYDQDPTQQLMDDVCNEANNCYDSYTENLHEEFIPLSSEKEFLDRLNGIFHGLNLLGKIDKLFHAFDQNI